MNVVFGKRYKLGNALVNTNVVKDYKEFLPTRGTRYGRRQHHMFSILLTRPLQREGQNTLSGRCER